MVISLLPTTGLTVEAATKPKLAKKSANIVIGGTSKIKVKNAPIGAKITYKSAKKNIATVSKKGKVTAIKSGTTKITVSVKKSSKTTKLAYKVTVKKPKLSKSNLSLVLGKTAILSVKNKPKKAKYTWESSNPQIATVNKTGKLTAKAKGITEVKVKIKTTRKTYNLSCKVTIKAVSEKLPEITINDLSDIESNNVDTETIDVSGTAKMYSGSISKVTYSLRFVLEEAASVNGEAVGTTNWKIENIPLQIGTSFLTITVVDSENKKISKEITLNRLNKEIELSEDVVLYTDEQTSVIANDIVDYWVDDMGTPDDTYDNQVKVLFRENSEIVQSIKSDSLSVGDVIMLQPCEELYLGFNGVLVSNEEPEDMQKYNPSEYEVVTFTSADYTDIFTGDVSLSYELTDTENPIAFAYFPSDVEIYSMDDNGEEQSMLYGNNNKEVSAYATEGMGDQTEKQEIKDIGFQKNALSYMMNDALNVTGGLSSGNGMNIGIKFRDTVLFDADGSKDTVNDQFKFGGNISYKNFKVDAGIEWHPNFNPFNLDLLPQQVMGKYSYTEEVAAHADWTGKISLNDVKDKDGNKVGLVKAANKLLNNDFENNKQFMGMTLSGVDMSDSIILGAFGLQISPVGITPTVGIKNAQYSSIFTPLSAILVIMPVLNVDGEISAKVGFTYNYSSYNEKGINMQKKDYVGAYGSLDDNRGQSSIELPFDRSLEVYNVCSKSSSDKSSDPVWSIVFTGEGKAEEKIALGADIGLMVAGIMPTSAEVKIYENAGADLKGQIKVDNENGFTLDGSAKIDAKIGVMAGIHFKLAASTALFSPEIKGDKEWDKVLWEMSLSTAHINGTVFIANDTNNDVIPDVAIVLTRIDQLGNPTQTTMSDSDGKYHFNNVAEGKYKLTFIKEGFDTYETDEFSVSGSHKALDAYLTFDTNKNDGENIFKQLPKEFNFTSGAGAWGTHFDLNSDGTFTGQYHDSNRGDSGNGYSNGTVYICDFKGKFSKPKQIDEYIYSTNLEYLNTEGTLGNEYYEDNTRYIYSEPYGFDDADEFLIYLPGCPLNNVSEEFLFWSFINTEIRKTLPSDYYGIYNVGGRQGFVGRAENNLWEKEYAYNHGAYTSELWPSYYSESHLLFWPKTGAATLDLNFNWEQDNQTEFVASDWEGTGNYDISLEFSEDYSFVIISVKSQSGYDLTPWGGTSDGTLSAKYICK